MTLSEHWEQFSAYRPMIEDARKRERELIIALLNKMRHDNYQHEDTIGYNTGWDMGLHDAVDAIEDLKGYGQE